jgi:hypothetical protein
MDINVKDMFGSLFPKKKKQRKLKVPEALTILSQEEAQKLIDMDSVIKQAVERIEQSGIIFLDEIDRSLEGNPPLVRMSPGKGFRGIFCPSWKGQRLRRNTGWSRRIISCSLLPGPFTFRSPQI